MLRFAVLAVALAGPTVAAAQQPPPPPPPPAQDAKADWELAHMVEVAQEARDWVQRRRDQLGKLPDDVQPLAAKGQERLQQLRDAIQARDVPRARSQFRLVLEVFEEIRVRLNAVMDAQDTATTTPEEIAATLDRAVRRLRGHLTELKTLAAQNPVATIDMRAWTSRIKS